MMPKRLPKLYLVRHGETEWTINGRHVRKIYNPGLLNRNVSQTGTTDVPLTANGESLIRRLGDRVGGPGKLIDPNLLLAVMVSPRKRAYRTYELLFEASAVKPRLEIDQRVREWTYGDYEGKYVHEIMEMRRERGLTSGEGGWDIWVDGCEGGESVEDITARVDEVLKSVKEIHAAWVNDPLRKENDEGGDVLLVSHGHFSRCLLARWLGLPLKQGGLFSLDPGGVCVMQYNQDLSHTVLGSMNLGII